MRWMKRQRTSYQIVLPHRLLSAIAYNAILCLVLLLIGSCFRDWTSTLPAWVSIPLGLYLGIGWIGGTLVSFHCVSDRDANEQERLERKEGP